MRREQERWLPRYAARQDVEAKLKQAPDYEQISTPVDISCSGAYLARLSPSLRPSTVIFTVPDPTAEQGSFSVERQCDILPERSSPTGGCAIRFRQPLVTSELAKIAADPSNTSSLRLAQEDYAQVNTEIRDIQNCRSHIFLGTLAATATWLMAAIGLVVANQLKNISFWIVIGAALPFSFLTIAILASIEKARAINLRRGFLAAVTDYLRRDIAPPNYLGWAHLLATRSECRARMAAGLCPSTLKYCWEEDRDRHKGLTMTKHVFSNLLDTFTAFTSMVYGILYAITCAIVVIGSLAYLESAQFGVTWVAWAEGALLAGVAVLLLRELYLLRKGKHSMEAQFLVWRAALRNCRPIARIAVREEHPPAPQGAGHTTGPQQMPSG